MSLLAKLLLLIPLGVASVQAGESRVGAFLPLPEPVSPPRGLVSLGERLFHDPRLASNNNGSCASCHDLNHNGADLRAQARGPTGQVWEINTPTIFNAVYNRPLNWSGSAPDLRRQAEGDLLHPASANTTWAELLAKLELDVGYRSAFQTQFGELPNRDNVLTALAAFETTLVTPNAPFDRYLRGEDQALSGQARHGLALFRDYGCVACHQGVNLGGNLLQRIGIFEDYFQLRGGALTHNDQGHFNVTGREADRHVFRVPSLRNVAVTAPYFHDGQVPDLPSAVRLMARLQLAREIPDADVEAIVAFLHSLTGEYRGRPLVAP